MNDNSSTEDAVMTPGRQALTRQEGSPRGSLVRGAEILKHIGNAGELGMSVAAIVNATDLPRPTVYRILQTLQELEWIERDPRTRKITLGAELALLNLQAAQRHTIEQMAGDLLKQLSHDLEQTIYISVRSGDDAVCVARIEPDIKIRTLVMDVGSRQPLGLGAGSMALLAALPSDERQHIFERNIQRFRARPGIEMELLKDTVARTVASDHAIHHGMFTNGVSGVGVALRDGGRKPFAALSSAFISSSLNEQELKDCIDRMKKVADAIARRNFSADDR
ncbi:IclR family transcriptional regulator [Rhodobacteraceae bacterium D3-12]|nr:IclR family transcriptional regulator [Rhodobacteraceae bacterium D3-12]